MVFFKKKKEEITIYCPIDGEVKSIEEVPDPVFAKKMMGDGIMIKPTSNQLLAPCDAIVKVAFPTKHAIGLRLKNGTSLLIHFGLETVNLKGNGFECHVKQGDKVSKGQLLLNVDLDYIRENATDDCVIMAFSDMQEDKQLVISTGEFKQGQEIIKIV